MRSQCALRGHLASGGALLGAVAHAPVREAEAVLAAAATSAAATAEAIGRATAWGPKEGLLVSSGGLRAPGLLGRGPAGSAALQVSGAPCASLAALGL